MGEVYDIGQWRARKAARSDIPIGAPPFVLAEACEGCGARRVSTMVWRMDSTGRRAPFPRIEPHFRCRDGRVLWQDISDAPLPVSSWSGVLGHFEDAESLRP
jgi:hypothetical protein